MLTEAEQRRFLSKFTIGDECWEWQACLVGGYGQFAIDRRPHYAHRLSYEMFVGPIPEGLQLDHLCRNRCCVRPDHLEPVTRRENILRGESVPARNARKTHCKRGHELTVENTYVYPKGNRQCRICKQMLNRVLDSRRLDRAHRKRVS